MAEIILTDVLNRKISVDELFQWLTSNDLEETISSDILQDGSTRANFVSYFLNYLREQSKSILPDLKELQEKLEKKAPNDAKNAESATSQSQYGPRLHRPGDPTVNRGNPVNHHTGQAVRCPIPGQIPIQNSESAYNPNPAVRIVPVSPRAVNSTIVIPGHSVFHQSGSEFHRPGEPTVYPNNPGFNHAGQGACYPMLGQTPIQSSDPKYAYSPQLAGRIAPVSPQMVNSTNVFPQNSISLAHFPSLPYQLNSSSPISSNRVHAAQPPLPNHQPGGPQLPQNDMRRSWNSTLSPQFSCPNNTGDARFATNPNSPYNSPNVSGLDPSIYQALSQKCVVNASPCSGVFDNSLSNVSADIASPMRPDNSMRNESGLANAPFSPLSPIYANNVSVLCPRKTRRSHNKTANSQDHAESAQSSRSNTPLNAPGSGQKAPKALQNASPCLGDFFKTEGSQGSKKGSRKQLRTQQWRKMQDKTVSPTDGKESPASGAKSKRRINPTRLDVSGGDKGSPGKEVFGVISRPSAANPKFVEAPSTDKSQEEVSFEVERGLLKLERQRQPKNESISEAINTTEQKLPMKLKKPESTVVACVNLVENIETLNVLANLYSGILDRNLMANPMTELYFLVTLLTNQYKTVNNQKSTENSVNTDKPVSRAQLLNRLKNDLGCAELKDDISITETDEENSLNSDEKMRDKSSDLETEDSSTLDDLTSTPDKLGNKTAHHAQDYLGTAHNCVYFATMVMLNQQSLLSTLDRVTLKLLCENHQINAFQPELQKYLSEIYRIKSLQTKSIKQTDLGSLQTNVCFQVDTDNRETFPSATSFSLFRKQRDLFYDILKDWEDNHLKRDWSFVRASRNKINTLLSLHTDAVNYCHFAKLFVSQLLVSSIQSGQTEDPINDESLSFLKSLKDVNPEKLMQLKGRLVTPLTSTGPVPKPVFPGVQEFYKNFILSATDWKFRVILETTFIHEIMELNDTQFMRSEIEGTETTVDESTKQHFITCVSSLRLLAKFMGFTSSLPFIAEANSPEWLVSQIQLRGRVHPSLDLQCCLLDSVTYGRLLLTVPWIVQYMSMLDTITLRLPYYMNIGEELYRIYRMSNQLHPSKLMSPQTATLMMFTIGWLFELPNFPRDLYVYWQMNYDGKMRRLLGESDENQRPKQLKRKPLNVDSSSKEFSGHNSSLDKLDIIDDRTLYECCPFLAEFKILLISGNAVLGNTNANRHITPVSSQLSQPTFGAKTKNLQMQLEESFFHGQPSSIRKTVDFVSERVASSCVKFICNSIIPFTKQRNMETFSKSKNQDVVLTIKYYARDAKEEEENSPEQSAKKRADKQLKLEVVEPQLKALATLMKEDVKREYKEQVSVMCKERTIKSIESLLADDTFRFVKETCTAIARRMAIERIDEWAELHITDTLFMKNLVFELKKFLKEADVDQTDKESRHNPEALCPTEMIGMMRNFMWELLEQRGRWMKITAATVTKTLKCLRQTLTERADLADDVEKNLYKISVEYCLLLLTNKQELFSVEVQEQFISVWKMNNSNRPADEDGLFAKLISPRNIRLLTHRPDKTALRVFGRLLKGLLKAELLNIEALSDQCVALFRQEWPEEILKQLSQCLNEVVADYKSNSAHAECVKNLLVWIAATCDDMDRCDYD